MSFTGNISVDNAPRSDGVAILGLATNVILRGLSVRCCSKGFSVDSVGVSGTGKRGGRGGTAKDANGLCDFFDRGRGIDREVAR
jgi:hypothetical protein